SLHPDFDPASPPFEKGSRRFESQSLGAVELGRALSMSIVIASTLTRTSTSAPQSGSASSILSQRNETALSGPPPLSVESLTSSLTEIAPLLSLTETIIQTNVAVSTGTAFPLPSLMVAPLGRLTAIIALALIVMAILAVVSVVLVFIQRSQRRRWDEEEEEKSRQLREVMTPKSTDSFRDLPTIKSLPPIYTQTFAPEPNADPINESPSYAAYQKRDYISSLAQTDASAKATLRWWNINSSEAVSVNSFNPFEPTSPRTVQSFAPSLGRNSTIYTHLTPTTEGPTTLPMVAAVEDAGSLPAPVVQRKFSGTSNFHDSILVAGRRAARKKKNPLLDVQTEPSVERSGYRVSNLEGFNQSLSSAHPVIESTSPLIDPKKSETSFSEERVIVNRLSRFGTTSTSNSATARSATTMTIGRLSLYTQQRASRLAHNSLPPLPNNPTLRRSSLYTEPSLARPIPKSLQLQKNTGSTLQQGRSSLYTEPSLARPTAHRSVQQQTISPSWSTDDSELRRKKLENVLDDIETRSHKGKEMSWSFIRNLEASESHASKSKQDFSPETVQTRAELVRIEDQRSSKPPLDNQPDREPASSQQIFDDGESTTSAKEILSRQRSKVPYAQPLTESNQTSLEKWVHRRRLEKVWEQKLTSESRDPINQQERDSWRDHRAGTRWVESESEENELSTKSLDRYTLRDPGYYEELATRSLDREWSPPRTQSTSDPWILGSRSSGSRGDGLDSPLEDNGKALPANQIKRIRRTVGR
ncbi:hypothetical protein BJ742DRAFT_448795, partial [Cladochytrium replicatum]